MSRFINVLHLALSSNFVSENRIRPLNNSSESISPLLSISQITKTLSLAPKIYSNSVKSIEKLSQTDLKLA